MSNVSEPKKGPSIDPGKISSWISLGGAIFGMLTGLANSTGSVYNPIDTIFIFILCLTFSLYICAFSAMMLLGLSTLVFGEDYLTTSIFVVVGIVVVVIAVPAGIDYAIGVVQLGNVLLFASRFFGVGFLVLTAWLINKYVLSTKN